MCIEVQYGITSKEGQRGKGWVPFGEYVICSLWSPLVEQAGADHCCFVSNKAILLSTSGEQEINDRWHRYALGVWALVAFRACHLCVLADGAQLGGWLCTSSAACRLCRGIRGSPGTGQGKRPSQWVGRIGCLIPSPGHRLQSVQKAAERSFPGLLCLNCDKQILCKW